MSTWNVLKNFSSSVFVFFIFFQLQSLPLSVILTPVQQRCIYSLLLYTRGCRQPSDRWHCRLLKPARPMSAAGSELLTSFRVKNTRSICFALLESLQNVMGFPLGHISFFPKVLSKWGSKFSEQPAKRKRKNRSAGKNRRNCKLLTARFNSLTSRKCS